MALSGKPDPIPRHAAHLPVEALPRHPIDGHLDEPGVEHVSQGLDYSRPGHAHRASEVGGRDQIVSAVSAPWRAPLQGAAQGRRHALQRGLVHHAGNPFGSGQTSSETVAPMRRTAATASSGWVLQNTSTDGSDVVPLPSYHTAASHRW
jgi:hypothetical protein